jgi:GxxExxY protein
VQRNGGMTTPQPNHDPRTYEIISAAFDVHREVGAGSYGEGTCRDALAVEFQLRKIPFMTEVPYSVVYKGTPLPSLYRADFVCMNAIIVEVKSLPLRTGKVEQAQMLKYLRASGLKVALLLNFGLASLEHRRFVMGDWANDLTSVREIG